RRDEAAALVRATMDAEGEVPRQDELYGVAIARGLKPRPVVAKLIDVLRATAVEIWIVSASPEIAVAAAMARFGLSATLIALRNRRDGAVLPGEVAKPCSIAQGKVDCIRAFISADTRPLLAVGDSVHDLPMIEYAEIGAVVDGNAAVTSQARRRGWFMLPR